MAISFGPKPSISAHTLHLPKLQLGSFKALTSPHLKTSALHTRRNEFRASFVFWFIHVHSSTTSRLSVYSPSWTQLGDQNWSLEICHNLALAGPWSNFDKLWRTLSQLVICLHISLHIPFLNIHHFFTFFHMISYMNPSWHAHKPMVSASMVFYVHLQAMEKNDQMKLKELNKSLEILCPSGWDWSLLPPFLAVVNFSEPWYYQLLQLILWDINYIYIIIYYIYTYHIPIYYIYSYTQKRAQLFLGIMIKPPSVASFSSDVSTYHDATCLLGGKLPTNRKWVITPVIYMGFL